MGKDARGIFRGNCGQCDCSAYEMTESGIHQCSYCGHLPISHEKTAHSLEHERTQEKAKPLERHAATSSSSETLNEISQGVQKMNLAPNHKHPQTWLDTKVAPFYPYYQPTVPEQYYYDQNYSNQLPIPMTEQEAHIAMQPYYYQSKGYAGFPMYQSKLYPQTTYPRPSYQRRPYNNTNRRFDYNKNQFPKNYKRQPPRNYREDLVSSNIPSTEESYQENPVDATTEPLPEDNVPENNPVHEEIANGVDLNIANDQEDEITRSESNFVAPRAESVPAEEYEKTSNEAVENHSAPPSVNMNVHDASSNKPHKSLKLSTDAPPFIPANYRSESHEETVEVTEEKKAVENAPKTRRTRTVKSIYVPPAKQKSQTTSVDRDYDRSHHTDDHRRTSTFHELRREGIPIMKNWLYVKGVVRSRENDLFNLLCDLENVIHVEINRRKCCAYIELADASAVNRVLGHFVGRIEAENGDNLIFEPRFDFRRNRPFQGPPRNFIPQGINKYKKPFGYEKTYDKQDPNSRFQRKPAPQYRNNPVERESRRYTGTDRFESSNYNRSERDTVPQGHRQNEKYGDEKIGGLVSHAEVNDKNPQHSQLASRIDDVAAEDISEGDDSSSENWEDDDKSVQTEEEVYNSGDEELHPNTFQAGIQVDSDAEDERADPRRRRKRYTSDKQFISPPQRKIMSKGVPVS